MGLGVFATADIKRGTALVVESPLLCYTEEGGSEGVCKLTEEHRHRLSDPYSYVNIRIHIFLT